jgi:hypothetical protein
LEKLVHHIAGLGLEDEVVVADGPLLDGSLDLGLECFAASFVPHLDQVLVSLVVGLEVLVDL